MDQYGTYLEKQIKNIDADIFVCCGSSYQGNIILDFLNQHGYNFERPVDDDAAYDIYYDRKQNKIAIDSYHLSLRNYLQKNMYNEIVCTYHEFLKKHPDFYKSHRI
jgi:hypothetical protein